MGRVRDNPSSPALVLPSNPVNFGIWGLLADLADDMFRVDIQYEYAPG